MSRGKSSTGVGAVWEGPGGGGLFGLFGSPLGDGVGEPVAAALGDVVGAAVVAVGDGVGDTGRRPVVAEEVGVMAERVLIAGLGVAGPNSAEGRFPKAGCLEVKDVVSGVRTQLLGDAVGEAVVATLSTPGEMTLGLLRLIGRGVPRPCREMGSGGTHLLTLAGDFAFSGVDCGILVAWDFAFC